MRTQYTMLIADAEVDKWSADRWKTHITTELEQDS